MLRKTTVTQVPDGVPPPVKPLTHEQMMEERLDLIIDHLHRMDRRDRWRTIGGAVRSVILLIPTLILLGSLIYVYIYSVDVMEYITKEAAKQAATYTQSGASNFFEQFKQYLPK